MIDNAPMAQRSRVALLAVLLVALSQLACTPAAIAESRKVGPNDPSASATPAPDRYILQLSAQAASLSSLPATKAQNAFNTAKTSIPNSMSTQAGKVVKELFPGYSTAGSSSPKNPAVTQLLKKALQNMKKNKNNSETNGIGSSFGDMITDAVENGFATTQAFKAGSMYRSAATFYGERDGSGTMGGACGYGNLYQTGYGLMTAAASDAMFNDGYVCGACYQVKCLGSPALPPDRKVCSGKTLTVTITNRCPAGGNGVCSPPKHHLDMSEAAWHVLSPVRGAGILTTEMRRVPCMKKGGVAFMLTGHEYYLQVLVFNVAGPGEVRKLEVNSGGGFHEMDHNWGAMYSKSQKFGGKELSFRLTATNGDVLTVKRAVPSNWYPGAAYMSRRNFGHSRKGKKKSSSSSSSNKSSGSNKSSDKGRKNLEVLSPSQLMRHFESEIHGDPWGTDSAYGKVVNVTVGMFPRN